MGNLTTATIFIGALNVLMWFSMITMLTENPYSTMCYTVEGSIIGNSVIGSGNGTILDNSILEDLPNSEGATVTASSSSVSFTDIFNNILGWFKSAPGIKYLYGVVAAPYNILKCMSLPSEFVVGIGTLWYLVSFLTLLAFLWGRD